MRFAPNGPLKKLLDCDAATLERLASLGPPHSVLRTARAELLACGVSRRDLERLDACDDLLRATIASPQGRPLLGPDDLALAVRPLGLATREELWVVTVDSELRPLTTTVAAVGNINTCSVEPSQVFAPALRAHANRLFVAHNHPSGNRVPSPDDVRFTRRLEECARLLGVELLDHLVITRSGWASCLTPAAGAFMDASTLDAERHRHATLASRELGHSDARERRLHTREKRRVAARLGPDADLRDRAGDDREGDLGPRERR